MLIIKKTYLEMASVVGIVWWRADWNPRPLQGCHCNSEKQLQSFFLLQGSWPCTHTPPGVQPWHFLSSKCRRQGRYNVRAHLQWCLWKSLDWMRRGEKKERYNVVILDIIIEMNFVESLICNDKHNISWLYIYYTCTVLLSIHLAHHLTTL